jgi:hypothetical protein
VAKWERCGLQNRDEPVRFRSRPHYMKWEQISFLRDDLKDEVKGLDPTSKEFTGAFFDVVMEQLAEDLEAHPHHYPAAATAKVNEYIKNIVDTEDPRFQPAFEVLQDILSDLE